MSALVGHQVVDAGWRQINHHVHVERAFEDVWPAIAADPALTLPDGVRNGGAGDLQLRVRLAGVEVSRPVTVHVGGVVVDDDRCRLALSWWDKGHRNLFPVLEAVLELAAADSDGRPNTRVGLVGRYRPPFGAFGSAVDLVAGAEIVAESVMRFVDGVARRIEAALPEAVAGG